MVEKEFIIKKISALLYSLDIVSLEAVLKAIQNLQKGKENNAKDGAAKRLSGIFNRADK